MAGDDRDRSYDAGAASHRALRAIRRELERHPLVASVRGFPAETRPRVVAELDPHRLDRAVGSATVTVRWFAGETAASDPEFAFHYSEADGIDCGWHFGPNPHVDGRGHFQERADATEAYRYEAEEFGTLVPARVVWEVMQALEERIEEG